MNDKLILHVPWQRLRSVGAVVVVAWTNVRLNVKLILHVPRRKFERHGWFCVKKKKKDGQ